MHNCLYAVSMHVRAYISMYVRMGGWMDGWMDGWIDAWISCGCMYHAGWMDGCMHGWMDACKKLHVRMLVCVHVCMYVHTKKLNAHVCRNRINDI